VRPVPWWKTPHRRLLSPEIMYLILQGPLTIRLDERLFLLELWRKHKSSPKRWPTQYQWSQFFRVHVDTVNRWVQHLEDAQMVRFARPYNIPDGRGGWKSERKDQGTYTLLPPTAWEYRNGWLYLGEHRGWVTKDGRRVSFPPDVYSFPKQSPTKAPASVSGADPPVGGRPASDEALVHVTRSLSPP
jgi:hypothetical protein